MIVGYNDRQHVLKVYLQPSESHTLLLSIIAAGSPSLVSGRSPMTTIVPGRSTLPECLCFDELPNRLSIFTWMRRSSPIPALSHTDTNAIVPNIVITRVGARPD